MQPCKAANLTNPFSRCYIPSTCRSSLNHFLNNSRLSNGTNYLARGDKENASTLINSPLRWSQHAVISYMLRGDRGQALRMLTHICYKKITSLNWQVCLGCKLPHCKGCRVPCWNTDSFPPTHTLTLHCSSSTFSRDINPHLTPPPWRAKDVQLYRLTCRYSDSEDFGMRWTPLII